MPENYSSMATSTRLPIYDIEAQIRRRLKSGGNLVISAPTGSGKSTQVPKMVLAEMPSGAKAYVLQPRRLPARVCAERVAWELGEKIGESVGYITRFERRMGPDTRIVFITEGILTRMLLDPKVAKDMPWCIVFDEFHERSINADLGIALARRLQMTACSELRLIAMSATLDAAPLVEFLGGCEYLQSDGRLFPVKITYTNRSGQLNVYQSAANALRDVLAAESEGDVLIFMPGVAEIRHCLEECRRKCGADGLEYYGLYGEMTSEEQHDVLEPARPGIRKVIAATNIAETSLTIPGVRHVIDSGLVKQNRYDSARGVNLLELRPISRDSADQRAGRAGRQAPGTCRRLWSELEQNGRQLHSLPEIRRIDLADAAMSVISSGCPDVNDFAWFEAPPPKMLANAVELLRNLKLADETGLTELGRAIHRYPVHPRLALLLHLGKENRCFAQTCLAAAVISERRGETAVRGLHEKWELTPEIRRAMNDYLRHGDKDDKRAPQPNAFVKCLIQAFPDRIARRISGNTYELPGRRRAELVAGASAAGSAFIVAAESRETTGGGTQMMKVELSLASPVKEDFLWELFPDDFSDVDECFWDNAKQQVLRRRLLLCRNLVLEESIRNDPNPDLAAEMLVEQLNSNNMPLVGWDDACDAWINRVRWLRNVCPEQELPEYDDDDVKRVRMAACLGETSYRAVKNKPCLQFVKGIVPADKIAFVEKMAPATLPLPRGRKLKIEYFPGQTPRGRARIQDLYDVPGPVTIAAGRVKILLDILAPNMRTVQITDDLPRFWQVHYPNLKSALARRYPKHEWR